MDADLFSTVPPGGKYREILQLVANVKNET